MVVFHTIRIADLGRVVTGKTPPSAQPELFGDTHPFLTPTDIDGFARHLEPDRFLSAAGRDYQHRLMLPSRAVCVVCIGATIGKVCMTDRPSFTNQQINSVVVNEAEHDPFFVYHLLTTLRDELKSNAGGAATPIINKTVFSEIKISVPPLRVQQRIAGILSAYDELIENSQRRIKILEEMARALYREWFVHFRFPGHEHHPRVASPLGEIPQGWEVKRLDEVCRSIQDGDWIETKDQGGEDYRLLQISNVGVGEFIETGNFRYVTQATFDRLRCNEIVPGDLLVARMPTPIGRGWLVTRMPWRMITAVDVAIIRAEPTVIHPLFLVQAWNDSSNLQRISAQASGTTRLRITRRELAAMEFVIPPIPVQQQFAKIAQPQSTMVEALRQQIQNLRRTRDLLLPRLLSGQVAVDAIPDPDSPFANSESGQGASA